MIKRTMTAGTNRNFSLQALLACGVATLGCSQTPLCPELGNCGGSPEGIWGLTPGHESCMEDLYGPSPPADERLKRGDVPPARQPPLDPAFSDWCGALVPAVDNPIDRPPLFFTESSPIGVVNASYSPPDAFGQGNYDIGFIFVGTYTFEFSATCMREFGLVDGRPPPLPSGLPDPAGAPADICKQLEPVLRASGTGDGAYLNTTCQVSTTDPGGCTCWFDRAEQFGGSGTYRILNGNELLHTPSEPAFGSRATFCRQGDSLELTGADGSYLFNLPGLRTLNLGPPPAPTCDDHIQNQDETGVDCGGSVCMPCPP